MQDWDIWIDAVTESGEDTDDPCWYAMYNAGLTPTEAIMTDEQQRDIFAENECRADELVYTDDDSLFDYDYYS